MLWETQMKILETITTTKGAYSLEFSIREDEKGINAMVGVSDSKLTNYIRLDTEDLRRIRLLINDHVISNPRF
jgi:hypothetical protein